VRRRITIVAAFALATALVPAVAAQQPPAERWRLNGSLGFHYSQASNQPISPGSPGSDYGTIAGDLRLSLAGFLSDPEFLPFSLLLSTSHGAYDAGSGDYRRNLLNWGASATLLPARSFPLRVFYNTSSYDSTGGIFGQNADTTTLGVEWTIRHHRLPHIHTGYRRLRSDIRLATSLTDNDYHQGHWFLNVRNDWKGWEWELGTDRYATDSNFSAGLGLPTDFAENLRILTGNLHRTLWSGKGDFRAEHRSQWRESRLQDGAESDANETYTSATLLLRPTAKLSSALSYNFVHVERSNRERPLQPAATQLIFLAVPSFSSHFLSGRVDYRLTDELSVFEDVRYFRIQQPPTTVELREALTESLTGANYQKSWRGFSFSAGYTGRLQAVLTNRNAHAHTFSNDLEGRVAWGKVRTLRLTGLARYSKLNLVEQLNGFSKERRFRLEATTEWLRPFRLDVAAEQLRVALLNLGGRTEINTTNFNVQLSHRRGSLAASQTLGEGAGAVFPADVMAGRRLSLPLPVEQLVDTPLLDRTTRITALQGALRLVRNLDLYAQWRSERNLFASSTQKFRVLDARLRYRIGKLSLDAGWARYRSAIAMPESLSGLRVNRYFFRVARDFKVF
jgi:hypothetical protein